MSEAVVSNLMAWVVLGLMGGGLAAIAGSELLAWLRGTGRKK